MAATMSDEQEQQKIRDVMATWMRATIDGDLKTVLTLMHEDVVFLLPGQPAMRGRDAFAVASRPALGKVRFEGKPEIQEIQIAGNYAFCWSYLSVTVTPLDGGSSRQRAGNILSIFRKESDGHWVLYRDANMLTAV
jgi:uncharacterized protein (TIGR02246 family)